MDESVHSIWSYITHHDNWLSNQTSLCCPYLECILVVLSLLVDNRYFPPLDHMTSLTRPQWPPPKGRAIHIWFTHTYIYSIKSISSAVKWINSNLFYISHHHQFSSMRVILHNNSIQLLFLHLHTQQLHRNQWLVLRLYLIESEWNMMISPSPLLSLPHHISPYSIVHSRPHNNSLITTCRD